MIILQDVPAAGLPAELFHAFVDAAPVAMVVLMDGLCVYANADFSRLRGCEGGQCRETCGVGQLFSTPEGATPDWTGLAAEAATGVDVKRPMSLLTQSGRRVDTEITLRGFDQGGCTGLLLTLREVAEESRMRRLLDHMAFYDTLTELPNRALLFDRLSQALARQRRQEGNFAVLMLDLDGFKAVNDSHGHAAGDDLLCGVARRLQSCVRDSDTVARMGGDEFAVLLHGIPSEAEAARVADKILRALAQPFNLGDFKAGVGVSIGIALCPVHGASLDGLLVLADQAMYRTKQDGKCGFTFATTPQDGERAVRGVPWVDEIALGHELMDRQHRALVMCVNRIIEILAGGREPAALQREMAQLAQLTSAHFLDEERLMEPLACSFVPRHRESHRRLLGELQSLAGQIETAGFSAAVQSIRDWLLDHIRIEDRELVAQLRSRSASA